MDDISRIEDKLDSIGEAVTELRSMWPHVCRRIDKLEHDIYGNGHQGLIARVQTMYFIGAWVAAASGTIVGGAIMYALVGKFL